MSENSVFYSETESIVDTVIRTAVVVASPGPRPARKPDLDDVVKILGREATRKISAVFSQLSSLLRHENQALKAKVGILENELKTVTENFENATMWRENVLSGCPVLFERSGLVYTLKLLGKLKRKTDQDPEGVAESPPAPESGEGSKELNSEATSSLATREDAAEDSTPTNTFESKTTVSQNTQGTDVSKKGKQFPGEPEPSDPPL
ncbi:hypothetical protein Q5P01_009603 [Channa striata]|uniref:Uncharacterized protein n=1 Tax=Channa striata TaxID=64152 RepID=A0AA88MWD5_CHASR|nr:hypothetical protein Q5P01_009603 [Channa striata]